MYCSKCGNQIDNDSKFCSSCGNDVFDENIKQQSDSNLNDLKHIKIILGIILAIIVIVLSALIYDACTTSAEEASEKLRRTNREIYELQDEIYDLEIKKSIIESLID